MSLISYEQELSFPGVLGQYLQKGQYLDSYGKFLRTKKGRQKLNDKVLWNCASFKELRTLAVIISKSEIRNKK